MIVQNKLNRALINSSKFFGEFLFLSEAGGKNESKARVKPETVLGALRSDQFYEDPRRAARAIIYRLRKALKGDSQEENTTSSIPRAAIIGTKIPTTGLMWVLWETQVTGKQPPK